MTYLAAYSSGRSYSSFRSTSSGYSTRSYSTSRSVTSTKSAPKATSKSTTKSTITKSAPRVQARARPKQVTINKTTVVNQYHTDHYGYHGFFHPFGMGYGGGDFWFWMYMFNHQQYVQTVAVAANPNTTPVSYQAAPGHSLSWWIAVILGTGIVIGAMTYIVRRSLSWL